MRIYVKKWVFLLFFCATVGAAMAEQRPITMATTTSTDNSGLLKQLLPAFQQATGDSVRVIAVGTGKALRMGRDGDVDVVLVHAPAAEMAFVNDGYGIDRQPVMYNDFIFAGPASDPAQLAQANSGADALGRIARAQAVFVSRGDDSGTHKKERALWQAAGIEPQGRWYREAGQGMGKVLQMASELGAYTLVDRGTWLAYQGKTALRIAYQGDPAMHNPYGIIAVNPARVPEANYAGAKRLIEWITAAQGQQLIGDFRINGEPLFVPSAHPAAAKSAAEPQR
jgi:tungstate transport system substrate-binding protein